jgi:Tripartite tricarboxylate transporter family receptor
VNVASGAVSGRDGVLKLPRRTFLYLAAGVAALPAMSRFAWAQAYPARPVRIIVGFAPAGGTDIMARLIGQWLSERLGQQFVIENRPGAVSNIGTEMVVNAPPDGYTLLVATFVNAVNATLYDKLNFNFIRDIAPVASIAREPFAIEVHPSVPVKTVPEFVAYAKANPGKINMGSAGIGSGNHVAGELFKMMTGVNLVHVPYRGAGPALVDLLGGQVQVLFASISSSTRAGSHHRHTLAGAAGPPNGCRIRARLRVQLLDRYRRAAQHASRVRRQAQYGGQRGPCRSQDEGAAYRMGRHRTCRLACRLRQAYCRRD